MRVESAKPCGNGGWLHALDAKPQAVPEKWKPLPPPINAGSIIAKWQAATSPQWITDHAKELGVSALALESLGIAWAAEHQAWAFPMKDSNGGTVGIRLRKVSGAKFAVKGSRQGLFIPAGKTSQTLYICEGPTDTAAALTLGLFAIGRPACLGCEDMVNTFAAFNGVRQIVIVADADAPGQRGAEKMSAALRIRNKIWTPAAKDIRAAVVGGLTAQMLKAVMNQISWNL